MSKACLDVGVGGVVGHAAHLDDVRPRRVLRHRPVALLLQTGDRLRHTRGISLGGVPREQKIIKGHLPRVIYHPVYQAWFPPSLVIMMCGIRSTAVSARLDARDPAHLDDVRPRRVLRHRSVALLFQTDKLST